MGKSDIIYRTLILWIGLIAGCAKERPLQPTPLKYYLYVATIERGRIYTLDCARDSVVDSLSWPLAYDPHVPGNIFASTRPGILMIPDGTSHKVVDMRTHEIIASLESRFTSIAFFPEYGRIVGARAGSTVIFEDTSYSIRQILDVGFIDCAQVGTTAMCIGSTPYLSTRWPLLIFDVMTGQIVDSLSVNPNDDRDYFWHTGFDISGDGTRIYGAYLPDAAPDWSITGIDINRKVPLFDHPMNTVECDAGKLYLTPNEGELWLEWDWSPWCHGTGDLWVLDPFSGARFESIGLGKPLDDYIAITQVKFLPEEPKAYVAVVGSGEGRNAVVALNSETHEVIKIFQFSKRQYPVDLAIGPAF